MNWRQVVHLFKSAAFIEIVPYDPATKVFFKQEGDNALSQLCSCVVTWASSGDYRTLLNTRYAGKVHCQHHPDTHHAAIAGVCRQEETEIRLQEISNTKM